MHIVQITETYWLDEQDEEPQQVFTIVVDLDRFEADIDEYSQRYVRDIVEDIRQNRYGSWYSSTSHKYSFMDSPDWWQPIVVDPTEHPVQQEVSYTVHP